jgi:2'-5' RNA ligase
MRLFVAIQLPDDVRRHLRETQSATADALDPQRKLVAWTPADNFHLTLKFLGEVAAAQMPALLELLPSHAAVAPFSLRIGSPLLFPSEGRARIVAVTLLDQVDRAGSLADALDAACAPAGIARENRPWLPHITIGRAKHRLPRRQTPEMEPGPAFVVNSLHLMSSDLRPTGPVYRVVAELPFTSPRSK